MSTSAKSVSTTIAASATSGANTGIGSGSTINPAPKMVSTTFQGTALKVTQETETSLTAKVNQSNAKSIEEFNLLISKTNCSLTLNFKQADKSDKSDNQSKQREVNEWISSNFKHFVFLNYSLASSASATQEKYSNLIKLDCTGIAIPLIKDLFSGLLLKFPDIFTSDILNELLTLISSKLESHYPDKELRKKTPVFVLNFFHQVLKGNQTLNKESEDKAQSEISKLKGMAQSLDSANQDPECQVLLLLALALEKKNFRSSAAALFKEIPSLDGANRFYSFAQAKMSQPVASHPAAGNTAAAVAEVTATDSAASNPDAAASAKSKSSSKQQHHRTASLPSYDASKALAAKVTVKTDIDLSPSSKPAASKSPVPPPRPARPAGLSVEGLTAFGLNTSRPPSTTTSPIQSPESSRPTTPRIPDNSATSIAAIAQPSSAIVSASMSSPESSPRIKPRPPAFPPPNKSSAGKPAATRIQSADSTPNSASSSATKGTTLTISALSSPVPPAGRSSVTRVRSESSSKNADANSSGTTGLADSTRTTITRTSIVISPPTTPPMSPPNSNKLVPLSPIDGNGLAPPLSPVAFSLPPSALAAASTSSNASAAATSQKTGKPGHKLSQSFSGNEDPARLRSQSTNSVSSTTSVFSIKSELSAIFSGSGKNAALAARPSTPNSAAASSSGSKNTGSTSTGVNIGATRNLLAGKFGGSTSDSSK